VRTNAPSGFKVLTKDLLTIYLSNLPVARVQLGYTGEGKEAMELEVEEVGDGNLNFVYIVTATKGEGDHNKRSVVVKQALPYIRVVESWPLTLERAGFESRCVCIYVRLSLSLFLPISLLH
jgi:5-methylthioribose kinase